MALHSPRFPERQTFLLVTSILYYEAIITTKKTNYGGMRKKFTFLKIGEGNKRHNIQDIQTTT